MTSAANEAQSININYYISSHHVGALQFAVHVDFYGSSVEDIYQYIPKCSERWRRRGSLKSKAHRDQTDSPTPAAIWINRIIRLRLQLQLRLFTQPIKTKQHI